MLFSLATLPLSALHPQPCPHRPTSVHTSWGGGGSRAVEYPSKDYSVGYDSPFWYIWISWNSRGACCGVSINIYSVGYDSPFWDGYPEVVVLPAVGVGQELGEWLHLLLPTQPASRSSWQSALSRVVNPDFFLQSCITLFKNGKWKTENGLKIRFFKEEIIWFPKIRGGCNRVNTFYVRYWLMFKLPVLLLMPNLSRRK